MDYWKKRTKLKAEAAAHTVMMDSRHSVEIKECIEKSKVYGGPNPEPSGNPEKRKPPAVSMINADSVTALKECKGKDKAVLNFASYTHPGGGFVEGSRAQEESLCHASFLYNVLRAFPAYYSWNKAHKNRSLYENRAIYTPDVFFGDMACGVITCAAPNAGAALEHNSVSKEENLQVLEKRLAFIRDIAEENNVGTFVLGAFGCGVFMQDPRDVCEAIGRIFEKTSIPSVVIAVPGSDKNYQVFAKYFGKSRMH